MRALVGLILQLIGWGLAAWSLVAGLGFFAILMVNFVGTHGSESGRDIALVLTLGAAGTLLGLAISRFGRRLSRNSQASRETMRKDRE